MIDTIIKNVATQINSETFQQAHKATKAQTKDRPRRFVMIAFDQAK